MSEFRQAVTPDCAVAVDPSCCVVLEVETGGEPKRVTVTNVVAFVAALEDAATFARVLAEDASHG